MAELTGKSCAVSHRACHRVARMDFFAVVSVRATAEWQADLGKVAVRHSLLDNCSSQAASQLPAPLSPRLPTTGKGAELGSAGPESVFTSSPTESRICLSSSGTTFQTGKVKPKEGGGESRAGAARNTSLLFSSMTVAGHDGEQSRLEVSYLGQGPAPSTTASFSPSLPSASLWDDFSPCTSPNVAMVTSKPRDSLAT